MSLVQQIITVAMCVLGTMITRFLPFLVFPALLAIFVVVGIHLWKRNMLLSIAAGTVFYMLLVQMVF